MRRQVKLEKEFFYKNCSETIQVTREQTPEQIAEMVEEKLGGKPNITIECTGAESCIQVF